MTHLPARFFALIPCAGSGSRSGATGPKQYEDIAGVPMVLHTLKAFSAVPQLTLGLVVVASDDLCMDKLLASHSEPLFRVTRTGGETRAASVLAGLVELSNLGACETDWVLVHDAARCLVTTDQIKALLEACKDDPVGGVLAYPLADTLKQECAGRVEATVPRDGKWLAQTPQMFRLGQLRAALTQVGTRVTDESSAMESMGWMPRMVMGSAQNFKVTYPQDFALAQAVLSMRSESSK